MPVSGQFSLLGQVLRGEASRSVQLAASFAVPVALTVVRAAAGDAPAVARSRSWPASSRAVAESPRAANQDSARPRSLLTRPSAGDDGYARGRGVPAAQGAARLRPRAQQHAAAHTRDGQAAVPEGADRRVAGGQGERAASGGRGCAADRRRQPRPVAGMGGARFTLRTGRPGLRQQRGSRPAGARRGHGCGDALARRRRPATTTSPLVRAANGRRGLRRRGMGEARPGTAARRRQSAEDQGAARPARRKRARDRAPPGGGRQPAPVPATARAGRHRRPANSRGCRAPRSRRRISPRRSTTDKPMPASASRPPRARRDSRSSRSPSSASTSSFDAATTSSRRCRHCSPSRARRNSPRTRSRWAATTSGRPDASCSTPELHPLAFGKNSCSPPIL